MSTLLPNHWAPDPSILNEGRSRQGLPPVKVTSHQHLRFSIYSGPKIRPILTLPANSEGVTASLAGRPVSLGRPFYWLSLCKSAGVMNFWVPRYGAKRVPTGVKKHFLRPRPAALTPWQVAWV